MGNEWNILINESDSVSHGSELRVRHCSSELAGSAKSQYSFLSGGKLVFNLLLSRFLYRSGRTTYQQQMYLTAWGTPRALPSIEEMRGTTAAISQ